MAVSKALLVCLYYTTWLLSFSTDGSGLQYNTEAYNLLPPLLKELSQRPELTVGMPVPQSIAIKYMKQLYKMSATKEGIPKVHESPEYNTVRLFTPRTECKPTHKVERKDVLQSMDLTFNVGRVSALEQNLQSFLLYSVSKQYSSSNLSCTCSVEILDHDDTSPVCPHAPPFFQFQLRGRQRWVEIDVTSFLQPHISNNKQNIHLTLNLTCLKNSKPYAFGMERPFKISRSPPCLLLYLNDTSHKAYHRKRKKFEVAEPAAWYEKGRVISNFIDELGGGLQLAQSSRHRRDEDSVVEEEETISETFNFSEYIKRFVYHQHECELHQFRLRFSQLNWDKWILAPHHYSPDYCKGECPRVVGHRYGSPVHTIVQNIIYEKLDSTIPRPSCVPSEYRPMSVLIVEPDNSITYKEYQDMIATKCTCR
ncbi:growth/differentiation factor 9 [Pelobates fuscus]|uniref:growth/differentiation factor 9 n=1 Tax=Pelobates fuscus TaxID=191477 RepID=UPI002FE4A1BD